jgi:integrase
MGDGELIFCSPKSIRSRRTVSFTKQIALILTGLVAGKDAADMVFLTPTGLLVRTRNFRRVWLTACDAAGLPGLRVHDLRHTHAAILLSSGRTTMMVSRRLGHANVAVTDAIYGHLRDEADDGVAEAVEAAMAGLSAADFAAEVEGELVDELDAAA